MSKIGLIGIIVFIGLSNNALACSPRSSRLYVDWPNHSHPGPFSVLHISYIQFNVGTIATDETYELYSDLVSTCMKNKFRGSYLLFSVYSPNEFPPVRNHFISVPETLAVAFMNDLLETVFLKDDEWTGPISPQYPKHDVQVRLLEKSNLMVRITRSLKGKVVLQLEMDELMAMDRTESLNPDFCSEYVDKTNILKYEFYDYDCIELDGSIGGIRLWDGYTRIHFIDIDPCPYYR